MYYTRHCPNCGRRLLVARDERGRPILACEDRSVCGHEEPLPADLEMRLAAAPELPGLDS